MEEIDEEEKVIEKAIENNRESDQKSSKEPNGFHLDEMNGVQIQIVHESTLKQANQSEASQTRRKMSTLKLIKAENELKERKWKYSAAVINWFFYYLSFVYFFICFISIILTIPNFYK